MFVRVVCHITKKYLLVINNFQPPSGAEVTNA
jgi:hypothetical protein